MVRPAFLIGISANLGKLQLLTDSFPVEVEKTICVISTEHQWFCRREEGRFEPPWLQQKSVQRLWGGLGAELWQGLPLGQCPSKCARQQGRECW